MAVIIQKIKKLFHVASFSTLNPADNTTYSFGTQFSITAGTAAFNFAQFKFTRATNVIKANLALRVQTLAGSNEDANLYLRNVTQGTEVLVTTFKLDTLGVITTMVDFNQYVNDTDYYTYKITTPAYVTNPTGVTGTITLTELGN